MKYGRKFDASAREFLYDSDVVKPEESEFEGCCGAVIQYSFTDWCPTYKDYVAHYKDLYADYVVECEDDAVTPRAAAPDSEKRFNEELSELLSPPPNKISIIILNQAQKEFFPALEKIGFQRVSDSFINPASGNKLTVFVFTPKNKRK